MVEEKEIIIREFQTGDLRQVVGILASSFGEELIKLTHLPEEKIPVFLIDTGEVSPYPYPGYIVAERGGEIMGLIKLSWLKQIKPRSRYKISKILGYGWRTAFKFLAMRYLFPERPKKGACHVSEIAVKQTARRRGIATRLLNHGKDIAIKNGLSKYTLHVDASNTKAFNLYKKMGFRIEKRHRSPLARWLMGVKEWYFMVQYLEPQLSEK